MLETLGRHSLYHDYREIPRVEADIAILDPPWGTTNLKFDRGFDLGAYRDFVMDNTARNARLFLFGTVEMAAVFLEKLEISFDLVWVKPRGVGTRKTSKRPMRCHETIYVFGKKGVKTSEFFFDQKAIRTRGAAYRQRGIQSDTEYSRSYNISPNPMTVNTGYREGKTVIYYNSKAAKGGFPKWERTNHPTQKPLGLVRMLLGGYCPPGGTVLDPAAGSGTTLIAAEKAGMTCVTAEVLPKYRRMIRDRYGRTLFSTTNRNNMLSNADDPDPVEDGE